MIDPWSVAPVPERKSTGAIWGWVALGVLLWACAAIDWLLPMPR